MPTLPLSMLIPRRLQNVLVAGRCAGGDRLAQSAYRVKASCMAMGQAAGTAAAVAVGQGAADVRQAAFAEIVRRLRADGAIVPQDM